MKTRNGIWISPLVLIVMGLILILANSCKKDEASTEIKDADGNVYTSVTIVTQEWMVENLKTTKYNDGTNIPLVTDDFEWSIIKTPAYCWYDNDVTYKATYGALYNWWVADDSCNGNKNVCPTGWHVPTDAEWTTLTDYLGGESTAGGKLKEIGTIHWTSPNAGATNESGFTALPGGVRNNHGTFMEIWEQGVWWSSTKASTVTAQSIPLNCLNYIVPKNINDKHYGISLRCLKD